MTSGPSIDRVLSLVPDSPDTVLGYVRSHPELASRQDSHGYSILHAATSYNHASLLRAVIEDFHVDPNILDEDGETCLFNAENVDMARELLRLGVNPDIKNLDEQTAAEKLDDEDEQPLVATFLREATTRSRAETAAPSLAPSAAANKSDSANAGTIADSVHPPPPLPRGLQLSVDAMNPDEEGGEPDPDFRQRIEQLAARDDFNSNEGQRELRSLVTDAVSGLTREGQGPTSRRRLQ